MAPVGSYESLAAAIQAGADAVYFGVGKLNMRSASAANFTLDDLARIVATAHAAGVRTYLTVNTVIYEDEIAAAHEVIDRAKSEGIDAIIASDMAVILYARRAGVEVHISTQCNISNSEAVKFYAQWADTVVLARELSLEQVAGIRDRIVADDIRGPRGELVEIEMFAHGGVEFTPYRQSFRELLPSDDFVYMETYNASEGFFALADDPARDDMLLMLDYGTFYEFRDGERIVPLEGVECGRVYAMLITSINGLWRYEIGDTVEFTSTAPYRIRFAGRTRQYINVFGEELIVDNADRALLDACSKTGAVVAEYTVAPCYMSLRERGAHEWVVEFEREPADPERFAGALDEALRRVNSDYDAKRRTTLERQRIHTVGRGYFLRWMRARGKNKVPRLMNDRRVLEDVLAFGREAEAAGEGTAC